MPSATRTSGLSPAHVREHTLHMRDRGLRHDAVAEIEDKRPIRKCLEYLVDGAVERGTAGDQHQRIEVALHGDARLDLIARKGEVGHPIETHTVDRDLLHITQKARAYAARKSDHFCVRDLIAHFDDDALR